MPFRLLNRFLDWIQQYSKRQVTPCAAPSNVSNLKVSDPVLTDSGRSYALLAEDEQPLCPLPQPHRERKVREGHYHVAHLALRPIPSIETLDEVPLTPLQDFFDEPCLNGYVPAIQNPYFSTCNPSEPVVSDGMDWEMFDIQSRMKSLERQSSTRFLRSKASETSILRSKASTISLGTVYQFDPERDRYIVRFGTVHE
ncbi:MAG: hypothetical protein M1820_009321 [Bogoriella megaspora]|nr:MAG: hypothetical protein M1820_009321 [Bogoriella megaspora]